MSDPISRGWRMATVRGVPVYVGRSWPFVAVIIVATFGPLIEHPTDSTAGPVFGFVVAFGYAVVLLVSVLMHESAHAAMAQAVGCRVDRVVADLWGGHTAYESRITRPGTFALIAISGPMANLGLAALGYGAGRATSDPLAQTIVGALTVSNLFLAAFNLLPGLPLDGGYLVESVVWKVTGDRNRGLVHAGYSGRVVTAAVVAWMVVEVLRNRSTASVFTVIWLVLIAVFLWRGATDAVAAGRTGGKLETIKVRDVLHPVVEVALDDDAESVSAALATATEAKPLVVAFDPAGRPVGIIDPGAYLALPPERRSVVPLSSLMLAPSPGWVVTSAPEDTVTDIVRAIASCDAEVVLVEDRAGHLLGWVRVEEIAALVSVARA